VKHKLLTLFVIASLATTSTFAKRIKVTDITQYNECVKKLIAGDTIVLANGVWKDAQLEFKGNGTKDNFIYMAAETPGKVLLEGKSCLSISGQWLHISGLVFVNGLSPKKVVINFKTGSKEYAYNCVLTNCVINNYNQNSKETEDHWVEMWGKNNTVEYSYFGGKTNGGTTLVVWPNDSNSTNNNHHIYRNYFAHRPLLGVNGGETIRIGTSQVCTNSSGSVVEGNYFERCNGEIEIISNKSCDNKYLNNTFYECEGCLTLRHGNRATVSGNWFIGNEVIGTGGIRVINQGHLIYNNYFYKLRGDKFLSSLAIMNGIPDTPPNGYLQVKNVVATNNTFYDCANPLAFCVGFGERNRIARPEKVIFENNLIYCPKTQELIKTFDNADGIHLENNLLIGSKGVSNENGTVQGKASIGKAWNIEMAYTNLKAIQLAYVSHDILGQPRGETVIGAFQAKDEQPLVDLATSLNCGPKWYKP